MLQFTDNARNVWNGRTGSCGNWSNWSAVAERCNQQRNSTNVNDLSNTFDRHEEFVASDAISWRQGKFSWLEMVLLDCSASNQQTTLWRTQEIRQHESGFPKIPIEAPLRHFNTTHDPPLTNTTPPTQTYHVYSNKRRKRAAAKSVRPQKTGKEEGLSSIKTEQETWSTESEKEKDRSHKKECDWPEDRNKSEGNNNKKKKNKWQKQTQNLM